MNEYRQQQLRAAALIEQGATAEQVAAVYGWTKSRAAPEQIETGDKNALTLRRKCGIIKAMRRVCRQIKRRCNNMEHIVKVVINGETAGTIRTNRSLTVSEAMWALGYDINDSTDIERGYNDGIPGFYLDDCGNYQFDEEAAQIIY